MQSFSSKERKIYMKEAKRNPVAEVFTYAKDKKKAVFSVVFATISVFGVQHSRGDQDDPYG